LENIKYSSGQSGRILDWGLMSIGKMGFGYVFCLGFGLLTLQGYDNETVSMEVYCMWREEYCWGMLLFQVFSCL